MVRSIGSGKGGQMQVQMRGMSGVRVGLGAMRTDRNNNPIAAAVRAGSKNAFTKALDAAGVAWTYGDAFPGDASMVTIKVLGDPMAGARAILSGSTALQDWYVNHTGAAVPAKYGVSNNAQFAALPVETQNAIVAEIYSHEGGSGVLTQPQMVVPVEQVEQTVQTEPEGTYTDTGQPAVGEGGDTEIPFIYGDAAAQDGSISTESLILLGVLGVAVALAIV